MATYEEVRNAAIRVLSGKVEAKYNPDQYEHLLLAVEDLLAPPAPQGFYAGNRRETNPEVRRHFLEVFWDLFRQGVITLGMNDSNREFPFCRLTAHGKKIVSDEHSYFIHDVSALIDRVRKEVPKVSDATVMYLGESLQCFRSGCMLASTVMLGVAAESEFERLLEKATSSTTWKSKFESAAKERTALKRLTKFQNVLRGEAKNFPDDVMESFDTYFTAIADLIRTFRNEAGHPTGKVPDREQVYVLINLFVPYCKKVATLSKAFV